MKHRIITLAFLILCLTLAPSVFAQGVAAITYGSTVTGSLTAEAPLSLFVFTGSAGDSISARVIGLEPGMSPSLSLLGPTQQVLESSSVDLLDSSDSAVRLTYRLTDAGAYTLLVGGTPGQYTLLLAGLPAGTPTALALGAPLQVNVGPGSGLQLFTVAADPSTPLALQISNPSALTPFLLKLHDPSGRLLGVAGGGVESACLTVPAGSAQHQVSLEAADSAATASYQLGLSRGGCASLAPSAAQPVATTAAPVQPVATQEVAPQGQTAACTASSGGSVNVRSGPGTNYGIITTLQPGVQAPVVGQSDSGWIVIQVNGVQGFVSQTVVGAFGNCAGLPFIAAPPLGQQPQQPAAPTATQIQQQQQQATATQPNVQPTATQAQPTALADQIAPTATQPPPPTATQLPPTATEAAPVAPPDSNYALNVQLDGNGSVSDFVSYPDGDTEDVVSYAVNGLNNSVAFSGGQANLTFTFSCFGTGTQFIVFIVDGQTKSCGQTHLRVVNADSRTGAVRVQATGGEGTYVQWVVSASAPRTN